MTIERGDELLIGKTHDEFADYLRMVGADFENSGSECTPLDYREAAFRVENLAWNERAMEGELKDLDETRAALVLEVERLREENEKLKARVRTLDREAWIRGQRQA